MSVRPGQPIEIKADHWNRLMGLIASKTPIGNSEFVDYQTGPTVARVVNNSNVAVPLGGVLEIEKPVPTVTSVNMESVLKFLHHPTFSGIKPTADGSRKLAIAQYPFTTATDPKKMVVAGLTAARVNITNDAHEFATTEENNVSNLVSAGSGPAAILWKETTTTGVQWCLVRIGAGGGGGAKIALVQAPVGGIPACVGKTPGYATCAAIVKATTAGSGFAVGDYVLNGQSYSIENWTFEVIGATGDRRVQVAGHYDGAQVVGVICGNTVSSFFNTQSPNPGDPP